MAVPKKPTKGLTSIAGGKKQTEDDDGFVPLLHAPEWFDDEKLEIWRDAINKAPEGWFKEIDRDLLVAYCVAVSIHRHASDTHQENVGRYAGNALVQYSNSGTGSPSPLIRVINEQMSAITKTAQALGIDPTSRARLKNSGSMPKQKTKKTNAFEGF